MGMKAVLGVVAAALLVMAGVTVIDGMGQADDAKITTAAQTLAALVSKRKVSDPSREAFEQQVNASSTLQVALMALRAEVDSIRGGANSEDRQQAKTILLANRPAAAVFGQSLVWLIPGALLLTGCVALPGARRERPARIER